MENIPNKSSQEKLIQEKLTKDATKADNLAKLLARERFRTGNLSAKILEKRILHYLTLLYQKLFVAGEDLPDDTAITLNFKWQAARQSFTGELRHQLQEILSEIRPPKNPVKIGHVYCHFCCSYECVHSVPSAPEEVFLSYSERGIPRYTAFHQLLLDLKDERSELLFTNEAPIVALFQYGRQLRKEQLNLFGKQSLEYALLGQVVVGYLRHRQQKFALSLQLVKSGRVVLLNHIMSPAALTLWEDYRFTLQGRQVDAAIESARREFRGIENLSREAKQQILQKVPTILRRLANDIEAVSRRHARRTRHAEIRHSQKRPVALATEDLRHASPLRLFHDEIKDTWILWADKNRIHVFSSQAKLVTSLYLEKQAIERRISSGRWQIAPPNKLEYLKEQVLGNTLS